MSWGVPVREPTGVALETLRAHKLRSFLTLLGIILSVSTLIVVVALIEGTSRYIAERVANLGSNVFLVLRFPIITDAQEFAKAVRRNKDVTWEDYEALRDNLKLPKAVGVEVRTLGKVRAGTETVEDISVRGVTANIGEMDVEEPAQAVTSATPTTRIGRWSRWWARRSPAGCFRRSIPSAGLSTLMAGRSKWWVWPSPWGPYSANCKTASSMCPSRRF
jgi:hypothetical protein